MNRARRKYAKQKGRFVGIPYEVVKSRMFAELTPAEVKLLIDLLLQFNGRNNGNLSPCFALMKERGWASSSLNRAFNGLQHSGLIVVTRQGWRMRGKPTLIALTWVGIDDPRRGVQYDEGIVVNHVPLNFWCKAKSGWKHQPCVKDYKQIKSSILEDKN